MIRKSIYRVFCAVFAAALCVSISGCGMDSNERSSISSVQIEAESETLTVEESEGTEEDSEKEEDEETGKAEEDEETSAELSMFAMDTYMTLTAYGGMAQEAVNAAAEEIERLDALLSTGDPDSEVSRVNTDGGGVLSEDSAYLMQRSLELYDMTDGVFDVAIYPVMKLWGFADGDFAVPSDDDLDEALALTDMSLVEYDKDSRVLSFAEDGVEIDFGGIAKGYTAERVRDIFAEYGVTSGLINLGGDVWTYGTKTDGSLWRVGILDPDDEAAYLGIVSVAGISVVTSGDYERYFEEDGVRYHHIIDPETGYPADNGLRSVTVICDDGTLADGLSTSVFIMGVDKASKFWRSNSDMFDMVLFDGNSGLYITEGIADVFTSDLEYTVIAY